MFCVYEDNKINECIHEIRRLRPTNTHFNNSLLGIQILSMAKRIMNEVMCLGNVVINNQTNQQQHPQHQHRGKPNGIPPKPTSPITITRPPPPPVHPMVYPQSGQQHCYPQIPPGQEHICACATYMSPIMERSVDVDTSESTTDTNYELELYKLIAKTYGDILKTNNKKLLLNLVDQSGKVIADAESLVQIIAYACSVSADNVTIEYQTK